MTTPNYRSPTTQGEQDTGTKEQAKQTAGTAAEQGKHVAGVAKDEARQVTSEVKHQARNLVGEVRTQVEDQSRSQRDRLVGTLRTLSDDLEQMSTKSDGGMASDLVRQGAERVRSFTDNMAGREPSELLDEVRNFARRKPGTFLLGALVTGIVAGRLARGAKDAGNGATDASSFSDSRSASRYSPATAGYASGPPVDPLGDPTPGTGDRIETGGPRWTGDSLRNDDHLRAEDPLHRENESWSNDPARRGSHD